MFLEPFYKKAERKRMMILSLGLAAYILIATLSFYELIFFTRMIDPQAAALPATRTILSVIAQYGLGLAVCVLIMMRVPADPMEKKSMSLRDLCILFSILSVLMFAGDYLGTWVNEILGNLMGREVYNVVEDITGSESILYSLFATVLLAPMTEELVFRKILIDRTNRYGDLPAILCSGMLFGLFHGNFYQFFYAMFAGCVFAYVYCRSGRLEYCIGLHMMINFLFGFVPSLYNRMGEGILTQVTGIAFNLLILAICLAGIVFMISRFRSIRFLKGWLDAENKEIFRVMLLNPGTAALLLVCGYEFALNLLT